MRKVREILRLRFERGLSQRQISASTGVSKGALSEYLRRAAEAGVTWEVARDLDDAEVEARLFRAGATALFTVLSARDRVQPFFTTLEGMTDACSARTPSSR